MPLAVGGNICISDETSPKPGKQRGAEELASVQEVGGEFRDVYKNRLFFFSFLFGNHTALPFHSFCSTTNWGMKTENLPKLLLPGVFNQKQNWLLPTQRRQNLPFSPTLSAGSFKKHYKWFPLFLFLNYFFFKVSSSTQRTRYLMITSFVIKIIVSFERPDALWGMSSRFYDFIIAAFLKCVFQN